MFVRCTRAPEVGSGRAGPCGIFPLGLGQQAVTLASLTTEPPRVILGIPPSHADHWVALCLLKPKIVPRRGFVTLRSHFAGPLAALNGWSAGAPNEVRPLAS